MPGSILQVNDSNFKNKVLLSQWPVLLCFSATWSGPCRALKPVLAAIAEERSAKLLVAEVDVDQNQALARQYRVQDTPVLLLFHGGKAILQLVGFTSKQVIDTKLNSLLQGAPVMPGNIVQVSGAKFRSEVLLSHKAVLLFFSAAWAGPCKALKPVLAAVAKERSACLIVAEVDVDQNQSLAAQYKVQGIPMLLFFKGGKVMFQLVGVSPKHVIDAKLNSLMM